jgi:hypothetical protein
MSASFDESCVLFRGFLAKNGYANELVWITPSDVLAADRLLYVRVPVSDSNQENARAPFDTAMKGQLGVSFSTICQTDQSTMCSVWVPAD